MRELEEHIRRDGVVRPGGALKVDGFLNHQCDVELFDHMGAEWARLFTGQRVDKIVTIEASGIGIAIEKGFQGGGDRLRERGYHLESLAVVSGMDERTGELTFS